MSNISVEELQQSPISQRQVELVERKGVGHPDSMCDAIAEAVSVALCQAYLETFGRILHHNTDKGLLVAGITQPRLNGGVVIQPMRLVLGDRVTAEYKGRRIDVGAIAEASARDWLRRNLRYVKPDQHILFQNELKIGSPELTDLFERETIGANDTSAAVGYAPMSETEHMVLAAERFLNSPDVKQKYPEAGEDVKVMGYRRDRELVLTVALAFVDRFVTSARHYFARKEEIRTELEAYFSGQLQELDRVTVTLNTLDDPRRGENGMYLTVLGTSAEGGDCGQVGRGNKVNGLITLNRPMSTEAAAGKNPVSHVGKIYSVLSHQLAEKIYSDVPGLQEVYVWLCSQIGQPVDEPIIASAQVIPQAGVMLPEIKPDVMSIIEQELAQIQSLTMDLARGVYTLW